LNFLSVNFLMMAPKRKLDDWSYKTRFAEGKMFPLLYYYTIDHKFDAVSIFFEHIKHKYFLDHLKMY